MRLISRATHVVPIDPLRGPLASLAAGAAVLAHGGSLVWFSEGERSWNGTLQPFQLGVGVLLRARPVPAVPVWIAGTYEALPRGTRWPHSPDYGHVRRAIDSRGSAAGQQTISAHCGGLA